MPNTTAELGLNLALGTDDAADYETIYLANSLTALDGLFNQASGHTHSGAHQGGPINGNAFSGAFDIPDWFRSTGHRSAYATAGAGVELFYDGTNGVLQGYDRAASQYRPLLIRGSTVSIGSVATPVTVDAAGGLQSPGTITANAFHGTGNSAIDGGLIVTGLNVNGTATIATLSVTGNGAVTGSLTAHGDLHADRNNDTGVVYLGNSGSHYLFWDGSSYQLPNGPLNVGTNVTAGGTITGTQITCTNGNVYASPRRMYGLSDGMHFDWDVRVDSGHDVFTHNIHLVASAGDCNIGSASGQMDYYGPNGSTNHRFFHLDASWMGLQASSFNVQTSVDHARQFGKSITPIWDALGKISAIDPVRYFHLATKGDGDVLDGTTGWPQYGFSAKQVAKVLPEVADGEAGMIDYDRLVPILWQAVRELAAQVEQLKGATA